MRIGIDLGGTKIEAARLDRAGRIAARMRVATPRGDYRATLRAITDLVYELESGQGEQAKVGIGIPGTISPATGLVKNANSTWLIGRAFDQDLFAMLERPVRVTNDANCFALSEAVDGAAAGASPVFGVILGTGVGGGLVVDGRVLGGRNAIAGEWGHNPLPAARDHERPGPTCFCGRTGCIETFLSGPGLARDYEAATGRPISVEQMVADADAGDPAAAAALERYDERLARALGHVVNIVDPEVIVLGGGLSNIARLYQSLPARLAGYVFSDRLDTPVKPPLHGDSSGVRGAAWLWDSD